jgi:general secretion pathway protein G
MTHTHAARRTGFTLIELMVVIVVIAVLVALLLPAISRSITYANQVRARQEINQLENAIQSFEATFKVDYIPSTIKLCALQSSYGATQLDIDSQSYLLKLFPKLSNSGSPWKGTALTGGVAYVRWTMDSTAAWSSTSSAVLEGHQCLVFFLGGIQTSTGSSPNLQYGCLGFSTDPLDPSDFYSTNATAMPRSFDFEPKRLVQWSSVSGLSATTYNSHFLSYTDPISNNTSTTSSFAKGAQPYAYFSAYKTPNGYNRTSLSGYNATYDNPTLGITNGPYYFFGTSSPVQYVKPDTFQVICSGFDGIFGAGGPWAANGSQTNSGNVSDDLANFASGQLKAGQ